MMPRTDRAYPRLLSSGGRSVLSDDDWSALGFELALAPRELEVVKGVFDDLKELAIADDLGISPHTVHTYLERVYRKLSVGSRVELVVRVFSAYIDALSKTTTTGALRAVRSE